MSDTNSLQRYAQEKNAALKFAADLLTAAKGEDWLPGGWDAVEVSAIIDEYVPPLKADAATLTQAEQQTAKARELLHKILATWTGARACQKLGLCETRPFKPVCSPGMLSNAGFSFLFEGLVVRREGGRCSEPTGKGRY